MVGILNIFYQLLIGFLILLCLFHHFVKWRVQVTDCYLKHADYLLAQGILRQIDVVDHGYGCG